MGQEIKKTLISFLLLLVIILLNVLNIFKEIFMPWYRLFFAKRHSVFIRTPEDRFSAMPKLGYGFTSKYLEIPLGSGSSDNLPR